jgi:hypothetical protein
MEHAMIVLSAKKVLIGGSRTAQRGVFISFKSPDNILSEYVSIDLNGVNKYFVITEVSVSSENGDLEYTAIEAGYREDKVSSDKTVDIRDIIHYDINIVPESKESEIRKRSQYC